MVRETQLSNHNSCKEKGMALDEAGTSDLHMGYGKNRVVDLNAKIIYNGRYEFSTGG